MRYQLRKTQKDRKNTVLSVSYFPFLALPSNSDLRFCSKKNICLICGICMKITITITMTMF